MIDPCLRTSACPPPYLLIIRIHPLPYDLLIIRIHPLPYLWSYGSISIRRRIYTSAAPQCCIDFQFMAIPYIDQQNWNPIMGPYVNTTVFQTTVNPIIRIHFDTVWYSLIQFNTVWYSFIILHLTFQVHGRSIVCVLCAGSEWGRNWGKKMMTFASSPNTRWKNTDWKKSLGKYTLEKYRLEKVWKNTNWKIQIEKYIHSYKYSICEAIMWYLNIWKYKIWNTKYDI